VGHSLPRAAAAAAAATGRPAAARGAAGPAPPPSLPLGNGGSGDGGAASGGSAATARVGGIPSTPPPPLAASPASLDAAEIAKFNAQAAAWWDPHGGPSAALHALNPLRVAYIRAAAEVFGGGATQPGGGVTGGAAPGGVAPLTTHSPMAHGELPAGVAVGGAPPAGADAPPTGDAPLPAPPRRPLSGVSALDVGCAGGLVAEPLARLGARVRGIDLSADGVAAARAHAVAVDGARALAPDRLTYDVVGVEALGDATYDLVTCMEVVEHVAAPRRFVGSLAARVAPGGVLVLSTLNRSVAGWALGVVAAERVLGWVPPGTHEWRRFVAPEELAAALVEVDAGLTVVDVCGLSYRPLQRQFELSDDLSINYMLTAVRER